MKTQLEVIEKAKANKIPIVFLEYENEGQTNDTLKGAVEKYPETKFFIKSTDGMFENGNAHRAELIKYLQSKNIGKLIVTGANGGACVLESVRGSLSGNCTVIAYEKAIADFNFENFIYPYEGKYRDIHPTCPTCKLREVMSIDSVDEEMRSSSNQTPKVPKSNAGPAVQ